MEERFAYTLTAAGLDSSDRVALAFSFGPHVQFWAAKEGLQEVGAMGVSLGGMGSVQRLQTIAEVEATTLWCTPTYALRLLEVAVEQRLESTHRIGRARALHRRARGLAAGACARGSRRASGRAASTTPA